MSEQFTPAVYGHPPPHMSREDVEKVYEDAARNGQNVFWGKAWKHPEQPGIVYMTQPPIQSGFWETITANVAGFLGI